MELLNSWQTQAQAHWSKLADTVRGEQDLPKKRPTQACFNGLCKPSEARVTLDAFNLPSSTHEHKVLHLQWQSRMQKAPEAHVFAPPSCSPPASGPPGARAYMMDRTQYPPSPTLSRTSTSSSRRNSLGKGSVPSSPPSRTSSISVASTVPASTSSSATKECPECESTIDVACTTCEICGEPLRRLSSTSKPPNRRIKKLLYEAAPKPYNKEDHEPIQWALSDIRIRGPGGSVREISVPVMALAVADASQTLDRISQEEKGTWL
mmetsp:Transcript_38306/g.59802  ORF Transcript_38306/g.59802 Transcript_38306/m.59802 type:complete len:264 (-) Transcript_38306:456-1247(-)